jgi:hypothetical protein
MNSGHQLTTTRCNQSARTQELPPPEQEVASSNLAGRTRFQSVTLLNPQRSTDNRALSFKNQFHSGHQLATLPTCCLAVSFLPAVAVVRAEGVNG